MRIESAERERER